MGNDFDFDELMEDAALVEGRRGSTERDLAVIGTISVASAFFTAASILYIDARLDNPGMPKEEALHMTKQLMEEAVETRTRRYFETMLEYNDITSSTRFDTVEEAVNNGIETEHMILDVAFQTIERLLDSHEGFGWLCGVTSGKLPEEHLARVEAGDDTELTNLMDNVDWG